VALLEIREITLYENAPRISGRAVLIPRAGSRVSAKAIDVDGCVIPCDQLAVAIEFAQGASVVAPTPVTIRRPDVATAHPNIAFAATSGFRTLLLVAPTAETLIHHHAVLKDQQRIPLGRIRPRPGRAVHPAGRARHSRPARCV
jgi:hypothetical protein